MRIRALKPGFYKNEDLCALSGMHRLCFGGLWLCADREGRLEDRPRRLKGEIFPYDDVEMDAMLWDLAEAGFIVRYVAEGHHLIAIPNWSRHQHPRPDEGKSQYASYVPGTERLRGQEPIQSAPQIPIRTSIDTDPSLLRDDPDDAVRIGNGRLDLGSGILEVGSGETPTASSLKATHGPHAQDLIDLWNTTTSTPLPRCRELTDDRRKKIRSRLSKRPSLEEWRLVFEAIQNNPFCTGHNDRGWVADFDYVIKNDTVAAKALERAQSPPPRTHGMSTQGERNLAAMREAQAQLMQKQAVNG